MMFPSITTPETELKETPALKFAEMTLPSPAAVPPIVLPEVKGPIISIPLRFGIPTVPALSVPIKFPWIRRLLIALVPVAAKIPLFVFPEIRLRSAGADPPITSPVLFSTVIPCRFGPALSPLA